MSPELLSLPWEVQVALAGGYAAYAIANVGARAHHRTIDVAFATLVFGLLATGILVLAAGWGWTPISAGIAAFIGALTGGVIWRKWGRDLLRATLRTLNVTWTDDDPSALASLSMNARFPVSQICVLLDDGTWLRCDNTAKFNDAPYGPVLIGPNGDVAFYLTHIEEKGSEARELKTVRDGYYGDRIAYIPSSRIQRLTLRHMR